MVLYPDTAVFECPNSRGEARLRLANADVKVARAMPLVWPLAHKI
jgi:hypothetical protein